MLKISSFRKLRQSEEDIFDNFFFFFANLGFGIQVWIKMKNKIWEVGGRWGLGCGRGVEIGWWKVEMIVFRFSLK